MEDRPVWASQILSTDEVAAILKMSKRSIQRLVQSQELRGRKIGRSVRIWGGDLFTFVQGAQDHETS
jgi:excisionase family DNA binding protein